MATCEDCNREVVHVWKHREYAGSMTHRDVSWLCAECHPSMDSALTNASG